MKFAAFVMTFERESILPLTINKLLDQTVPPQEILIVDNSLSNNTAELIKNLDDERISYHKMGYNSGPSGAAHYGLNRLAEKGYDWIFWGDDDDPPKSLDTFEKLLSFSNNEKNIGIVGGLGGKFIPSRARTRNFYNKELNGIMDADYVAGGQMMIVNSEVVKNGILPTKKLFFGFEELDFCLKVKEAGFRIIFDGSKIRNERESRGDGSGNYKWKGKSFGREDKIWRDYYSIRNMLYILNSRKYFVGYFFFIMKNLAKIFLSYKYGVKYGFKTTKLYTTAFWHHLNNKYGFYGKNN